MGGVGKIMNKKIGILSLYYNSCNYGAVLQAYALCRVLNKMGFDAEQVQVKRVFHSIPHKRTIHDYLNIKKYIQKINIMIRPYVIKLYERLHHDEWKVRRESVKRFRDSIPHSTKVYTDDDISETVDCYDIFITGSDQVWGITQFTSPYLLNFVPTNKVKLSYAASMGYSKIDDKTKEIYRETLKSYTAISVREKDAVDMLVPLTDVPVVQCVDPTLLLDKDEWDDIASDRKIKEPYLLCYFLGEDKKLRKLAKQYANERGLKIVTFPHYPFAHHKSDVGFGDYKIYKADPSDFVTYIKFADYIFTNSFHGTVFSLIYNKKFVVFNRKGEERMISRIYSLMDMFNTEDRLANNNCSFGKIDDIINKPLSCNQNKFLKLKSESMEYLKKSLGVDCDDKIK
jgi:hypothetical protein